MTREELLVYVGREQRRQEMNRVATEEARRVAEKAHRRLNAASQAGKANQAEEATFTQTSHLRDVRSESPFTTPSPVERVGKLSSKQADPARLKDNGRTSGPTYKSWRLAILGKLRVNHDHYPTEEHRMIYVYAMTEGEAAKHLESVYQTGDHNIDLQSADAMIQYLGEIYGNPNERAEARREFKKLFMTSGMTFPEFRTKFIQLAGQGGVSAAEWKEEMFEKITPKLQDAVMPKRAKLTNKFTFQDMCEYLTKLDSDQRAVAAQRQALRAAALPAKTTNTRPFPYQARAPVSPTNLTIKPAVVSAKPAEIAIKPPVKCYNCFEPGHIARDCPQPKTAALKEMEAYVVDEVTDRLTRAGFSPEQVTEVLSIQKAKALETEAEEAEQSENESA